MTSKSIGTKDPRVASSRCSGERDSHRARHKIDMLQNEDVVSEMSGRSYPKRRLSAFKRALASATLSREYFENCGDYCAGGPPNITLLYSPIVPRNVDGVQNFFPIGANVSIVSGVLDVRVLPHSGSPEICPRQTCTMAMEIPVDMTKYNDSKYTECMRLEDGKVIGGHGAGGVSFVGFQNSTGLVTCKSTMLGEIFVLQHTMRLSPPPPPPPPSAQALFTPSSIDFSAPSSPQPPSTRDQASPKAVSTHGQFSPELEEMDLGSRSSVCIANARMYRIQP